MPALILSVTATAVSPSLEITNITTKIISTVMADEKMRPKTLSTECTGFCFSASRERRDDKTENTISRTMRLAIAIMKPVIISTINVAAKEERATLPVSFPLNNLTQTV